jgi:ATP-dependent DNA helicase RecG
MLPKEISSTKSSKSLTADTPVQYLKGVGPRLGGLFKSRGIETVRDLFYFFPRSYEDRTRVSTVDTLEAGLKATFSVEVISSRKIPTRMRGRSLFEVQTLDASGKPLVLKWFYLPKGYDLKFQRGLKVLVTGTPKMYLGRPEIVHPEITWGKTAADLTGDDTDPIHVGRVIPIYVEIEGVSTRVLRKILWDAFEGIQSKIPEDLPESIRQKYGFPELFQSLRAIHFPTADEKDPEERIQSLIDYRTPHHTRLIFEEFLKFELLVLRRRLQVEKENAPRIGHLGGQKAVEEFESYLPFTLTDDQKNSVKDVLQDLSAKHPMSRLIQGDVGSGKTAVAFLCAVAALSEGHQVALMAPTEILAEQHLRNAQTLFGNKIQTALLTGKTTAAEKRELLQRLEKGEPLFVFGTHALIEDPVKFRSLSLVMIDEQHRFGVEQRKKLKEKGQHFDPEHGHGLSAHFLVLTATPIPRTLALTVYGDLSVSLIQQMPPGRTPIETRVIKGSVRTRVHEHIRQEIKNGRQAYFIFPLIQESEAEGFQSLKSATEEAERLQRDIFPEFKVGLLHGQMKSSEKDEMMTAFKQNDIQILVSTTVVEVGVDVPNATVMVIENAERFGLSQIHQLRGRVGRGKFKSHCFLMTHPQVSESTEHRLRVLEKSSNGFEIAEADLRIRGPGEFLGTRQSGSLPFHIADLVRDQDILFRARDEALEILKIDPELLLPNHRPLRTYLEREGSKQSALLKTS